MRKKYSFEKICFIILSVCVLLFIIGIFNREDIKNATEFTRVNSISELTNEVDTLCTEDISNNVSKYSTKRLVVVSDSPRFDAFGAKVLSYGNIYILSYNTEGDCEYAYNCLLDNKKINSVEIDSILETGSNIQSDVESVDEKHETELKLYLDSLSPSKEVKVAILDTGVDTSKFNNIIDLGINLSSSGEENSIQDDNGHGTEIATIIGCNDYIKLVPIKTANSDGKATILSTYLGIQAAIENDVDIINISMNTYISESSKILNDIVNEASNKGISVVVSAGNSCVDVKNVTPSDIESAIVVSAIENDNCFASYSNYGETIDYCAYASYNGKSGTSYAAANVTSILADALTKGCDSSILDEYAIDVNEDGRDSYFGKGLISYFSSTGIGKVPDSVLENEEDIDFENEDLENLSTSATTYTYGTNAFDLTNGYLCITQGKITKSYLNGNEVTKNERFVNYYKKESNGTITGNHWRSFANPKTDYYVHTVSNALVYDGEYRSCTVRFEYDGDEIGLGSDNTACGFVEKSINDNESISKITGNNGSKVKITISGVPTDFSGVVEITDLDTEEGWGVGKTYLASEAVWTNGSSGCTTVTNYNKNGGIKVLGNHGTESCTAVNHKVYIHVKADSSGNIVLYYYPGTVRHMSGLEGVKDTVINYTSGISAENMPTSAYTAAYSQYKISSKTPTALGYAFLHWSYSSDGKTYNSGGTIVSVPAGTSTLTAVWKNIVHTLTIDPNGGTCISSSDYDSAGNSICKDTSSPFNVKFMYGSKRHLGNFNALYHAYESTGYVIGAPIRTGYTFTGWKVVAGGGSIHGAPSITNDPTSSNRPYGYMSDNFSAEVGRPTDWSYYIFNGDYDGDVTIQAQWSPKEYKVYWDSNGGTIDGKAYSGTALYNTIKYNTCTMNHYNIESYTRIPNWAIPNRTMRIGYTFKGWYDAKSGGHQVFDANGKYTTSGGYWNSSGNWAYDGDVQLYAQWTPNIYNLTINPNGGSIYRSATMNADNTWTTDITTETFTIKFQYDSKRHLGNFHNGYGGYDKTVGKPYKLGYIFEGWTVSGGTATFYPSLIDNPTSSNRPYGYMSDNFSEGTGRPTDWAYYMFNGNYAGNVTLTAKWKPITYKINYDKGLTNN